MGFVEEAFFLPILWYNNFGDFMDGILIINKEANMTSHDVVFKLRKILNTKKIGHSGTLDPNATGVMIVLVGKATKILPYIEDVDKGYIASMKLGKQTTTDDVWGETIQEKEITAIANFEEVLASFIGKSKQLPPMVSSIKINGKKLYEYARENIEIERPLRDVTIYDIACLDASAMSFKVDCSSGTYIRSLCVDIAAKTNNLGHMDSLVRYKVGKFTLEEASTLSQVEAGKYTLHSIEDMLSHIPSLAYTPIEDIYHGKRVHIDTNEERLLIVHDNKAVAIYERSHKDVFRSVRGLW